MLARQSALLLSASMGLFLKNLLSKSTTGKQPTIKELEEEQKSWTGAAISDGWDENKLIDRFNSVN